ncbi:hypothetical protein VNO78_22006 [Psophocarpus tetragonolobus]|uniref:Uncharacterized protein n=1 Tax=Psophocarpus tetragonolobus TaxID=3891 RepID=A0AAN9SCW0_PSOTE
MLLEPDVVLSLIALSAHCSRPIAHELRLRFQFPLSSRSQSHKHNNTNPQSTIHAHALKELEKVEEETVV